MGALIISISLLLTCAADDKKQFPEDKKIIFYSAPVAEAPKPVTPNKGLGPVEEAPPTPNVHFNPQPEPQAPPLKRPEPDKINQPFKIAKRRHPLLKHQFELHKRSLVAMEILPATNRNEITSEPLLALETSRRESLNDVLVYKHEYRTELVKAELAREEHRQNEILKSRNAITQQEFDESKTRTERAGLRADTALCLIEESKSLVTLLDLNIAKLKGGAISLLDLARAIADMWSWRVKKVETLKNGTEIEFTYQRSNEDRINRLVKLGGASQLDALRARSEMKEAETLHQLAIELTNQMKQFFDDALKTVKALEGQKV